MADRILLVGMMGSGKTTVGRALADRLGWPYCDSDEQVERNTGRTVPQIFEEDGEAAFRAEEKKALLQALASEGPVVVSVAGGAVLDPDNRARIEQGGFVVWLRAHPSTLGERVGSGEGRPLLADDPLDTLARLDAERRPLYSALADFVVDVDDLAPDDIAERILAAAPVAG